jgi:hypothetical protein
VLTLLKVRLIWPTTQARACPKERQQLTVNYGLNHRLAVRIQNNIGLRPQLYDDKRVKNK